MIPKKFDKRRNAKKYGYCVECGKALSQYDVWHSQGNRHEECFFKVCKELNK